jgi:predicted ester cyclase
MHSLIVAIPDWNFNMTDLCEQGDMVRMKVHITGTNTGEIDIPPLGLQHVPATNKCFALPDERIEITLAGDKIVSFKAIVPADGGVPGILQRLGVKIPEAVKV